MSDKIFLCHLKEIDLFLKGADHRMDYTHFVATKLHNHTEEAMADIEFQFWFAVGNVENFRSQLSSHLTSFELLEFRKRVLADSESESRLRYTLHQYIEKDCQLKEFKKNLAYRIFMKLKKHDKKQIDLEGDKIVCKIITDYIKDLYCIPKEK